MMWMWIKCLSVSLVLTLIFELAAALILKKRGRALSVVALVNVLTNPLVVSGTILWVIWDWPYRNLWVAFAEISAVTAEALIYRRHRDDFPHPWLFSLLLNGVSYGMGIVLEPLLSQF